MARRRRAEIRKLEADLVYGDTTVTAFINKLMRSGKKNLASRVFYGACRLIQERSGQEPLKVFRQALDNVRPRIEVKSRRVGGATYQVPVEVGPRRAQSLSLRWLVAASDTRPERTAVERVAGEIMDASLLIFSGVFIIGMIDNLLRPILIGKETKMPDYIILLTTIGGISIFGITGFIVGPIIASLFISIWSLSSRV